MPDEKDASRVKREAAQKKAQHEKTQHPQEDAAYARAENEDDDGYDPWSDRRPHAEPLFERDPWD